MDAIDTVEIEALRRPLRRMRSRSICSFVISMALVVIAASLLVVALALQFLSGADVAWVAVMATLFTVALTSGVAVSWFFWPNLSSLTVMARRAETELGLRECFSSALELHDEGRDRLGPVERGLMRNAGLNAVRVDPRRLVPLWDRKAVHSAGAVAAAALLLASAPFVSPWLRSSEHTAASDPSARLRVLTTADLDVAGQSVGPGRRAGPAGAGSFGAPLEQLDGAARDASAEQQVAERMAQIEAGYDADYGGGGWAALDAEQRATMARLDALRVAAARSRAEAAAEARAERADSAGLGEGEGGQNSGHGEGGPEETREPGEPAAAGEAMRAEQVAEDQPDGAGGQPPPRPTESSPSPFALTDDPNADQLVRVDNAVPVSDPAAQGGAAGDASGRGEQALAGDTEHRVDRTRIGQQLTLTGEGRREGNRIRTLAAPPGSDVVGEKGRAQALDVGDGRAAEPVQRERVDPALRHVVARYFAPADFGAVRD